MPPPFTFTRQANGETILHTDVNELQIALEDLGTMADQNASAVAITGGTITGIADLAVADGGTGASSAAAARTSLGVGTADSPEFAALNVGHASDTTITRASAGNLAVEGNALYRAGGTDVAVADGGTGQSTATAAFDALAPTTTQGDLIYHDGTDNVRLAKGTAGQALRMNAGATAPEWGNPRPAELTMLTGNNNGLTWTNMPAALTEWNGLTNFRKKFDLTDFAQVRVVGNVMTVGAASAQLRGQYSTDQTTWNYLDGGSGPALPLASLGMIVSAWGTLPAGAKADVFLRIVGIDGDGALDPAVVNVALQFK